jgi:DNA-binding CsgD family transcriptional regulator/tetratricopeptide (TPR) repeat protein
VNASGGVLLREAELLERDDEMAALNAALGDVREGSGRLVFVSGEAGVGKTALVTRFCDQARGDVRVLAGACDPLFTPRPLGPFADIAQTTRGGLGELIRDGAIPYRVAEYLMQELERETPTILVLEDVHWGDEATLDVLRLLGRRVERSRTLVIATYQDEIGPDHRLRVVLGSLATVPGIRRLQVATLSPAAVAHLAEPEGADPAELYRLTAGNPFFVTEVLAASPGRIPATVRDAVLARAGSVSPEARAVLEAVATAPSGTEPWLLEALAGAATPALSECLASGMLATSAESIVFRHELARLTIEESTAPEVRIALHRNALAALEAQPEAAQDMARLAHHADAAGDADAVLRFAPEAAARASALGAHREAAEYYRRALTHAHTVTLEQRASLLERYGHECYLTDEAEEAIGGWQAAAACYRELGDRRREGATLVEAASIHWCPGRGQDAKRAGLEAVALLEELPPGPELVVGYANMSFLYRMSADLATARQWSDRAASTAQELGDPDAMTLSGGVEGLLNVMAGVPGQLKRYEQRLEVARNEGRNLQIAEEMTELVLAMTYSRPFTAARWHIGQGLESSQEVGSDWAHFYFLAYRARLELDEGRWTDAGESAELVLGERFVSTLPRTYALVVLGLVRARRGDPGATEVLDAALELSSATGEVPRIAPVAAARAEWAWLVGRSDAVASETDVAYRLALQTGAPWALGELATIRQRAGIRDEVPGELPEPHRLQITGEWRRAAECWADLGCPYQAALALADDDDEDALRTAYDDLRLLGAKPAADMVARRLRKRGARGLPRGPRATTRRSAAGLTRRETEVLELVAAGLRNADIADRLFLSRRTVDHHVSTVLRKLEAHTRGEAVAAARRKSLLEDR